MAELPTFLGPNAAVADKPKPPKFIGPSAIPSNEQPQTRQEAQPVEEETKKPKVPKFIGPSQRAPQATRLIPAVQPSPPKEAFPAATPKWEAGGGAAAFLQPFAEFLPDVSKAGGRYIKGAYEALNDLVTGPGLGTRALGALRLFGDTAGFIGSPIEGALQAFITDPAERVTGVKGLGRYGAQLGSDVAMLPVDPFKATAGLFKRDLVPAAEDALKLLGVQKPKLPTNIAPTQAPIATGGRIGAPLFNNPSMQALPKPPGVVAKTVDALRRPLSPTTRGPIAGRTEQLIRGIYNGPLFRAEAQARTQLEQYRGDMTKADNLSKWGFRQAIEGDPSAPAMPGVLQPLADSWRELQQKWESRLLKEGILKGARDQYYPHLYRLFGPNGEVLRDDKLGTDLWAQMTPRPVRGTRRQAGLLKREYPYFSDVLKERKPDGTPFGYVRDANGQVIGQIGLRYDNPIDEMLYRLGGMQRYYFGSRLVKSMRESGFTRWVPGLGSAPAGMVKLDDSGFERWLPAVGKVQATGSTFSEHFEAFDPQIRSGLQQLASFLKSKTSRPVTGEDPIMEQLRATGYFSPATKAIANKFGSADTTFMHEIGHAIDFMYNLIGGKRGVPRTTSFLFQPGTQEFNELVELGKLRAPGVTQAIDPKYYSYITGAGQHASELVANLFHAYWHAPELLQQVAPNAAAKLKQFLQSHPDLKTFVDQVKPSVQSRSATRTVENRWEYISRFYPGVRYLGSWYAPEPMARVFNNFVSKGFNPATNTVLDGIRRAGNLLNMLQLGFSGLHFTFTSMETMTSKLSLALNQAMRGEFGEAGKSALQYFSGPVGVYNTFKRGGEAYKAWLDPHYGGPLNDMMKMFEAAGYRFTMDRVWQASGSGSFWKSIKGGYFQKELEATFKNPEYSAGIGGLQVGGSANKLDGTLRVVARTAETASDWLMGYWVPRVKSGVFVDMAQDWLRTHPNATPAELSAAAIKIADSVDNRMGQMIYDNLFWKRVGKDASYLAIRAVGWNMGTLRELGGGIVDTAEFLRRFRDIEAKDLPEFTYRMAYTAATVTTTAMIGAMLTMLKTGEHPKDWRDYFFPRTGGRDERGQEARISLPTYMKDVFSWNRDPVATFFSKTHPLWEVLYESERNRDYFGAVIRDPQRGNAALQQADYLAQQFLPFSWRGMMKLHKENTGWFTPLMANLGFVPASQIIVNPARSEKFEAIQLKRARRQAVRQGGGY